MLMNCQEALSGNYVRQEVPLNNQGEPTKTASIEGVPAKLRKLIKLFIKG